MPRRAIAYRAIPDVTQSIRFGDDVPEQFTRYLLVCIPIANTRIEARDESDACTRNGQSARCTTSLRAPRGIPGERRKTDRARARKVCALSGYGMCE